MAQTGRHSTDFTEEVRELGADQALERVDRFRDDLRNLRQRWDNRLVLKRSSWPEAYLDGRLEIALYGNWPGGADKKLWLGCVSPDSRVSHHVSPDHQGDVHTHECDIGDEQVMLVVIVEIVESPKRFVRSVLRPYLIKDEVLSSGQGLLYEVQDGRGYKVLPRWVDREMLFGFSPNSSHNACAQVVEGGPEIVGSVSYRERQRLRDWLCGAVNEPEGAGLVMGPGPHIRLHSQSVEIVSQGTCHADKFVNVAVGPLNL